ncbi:MAG: hypothetical protein N3G77_07355 [Nitrososphaeria archaeon]|nr:hypothetical protein [Nitrososphaeria archaeon]
MELKRLRICVDEMVGYHKKAVSAFNDVQLAYLFGSFDGGREMPQVI